MFPLSFNGQSENIITEAQEIEGDNCLWWFVIYFVTFKSLCCHTALGMFCYYHCWQFWTLKFTVFDVKISIQGCNIYKENIAVEIKFWRGCLHTWADSRINTENLIFFYLSKKQETIWKTFISIWQKMLLTIHNHYQSILWEVTVDSRCLEDAFHDDL